MIDGLKCSRFRSTLLRLVNICKRRSKNVLDEFLGARKVMPKVNSFDHETEGNTMNMQNLPLCCFPIFRSILS